MNAPAIRTTLCAILVATLAVACRPASEQAPATPEVAPFPGNHSSTAHFILSTTADPASTREAGLAAEALFTAYAGFFAIPPRDDGSSRFKLRIYASRDELQANSRSRPWAEAYYLGGVSHAYVDLSQPNPHHWLIHEVVHQLNREMAGVAREKWLNEGLATYFGSSRYAAGRLDVGAPDAASYPLWWLDGWPLSGDFDADVRAHNVIPLRALITGQGGPPLDATVNAHYLGWWSLTHFLLHHDDGRYAEAYRGMLRDGGSLADFEQRVGPLARVEAEWYSYLLGMVAQHSGSTPSAALQDRP